LKDILETNQKSRQSENFILMEDSHQHHQVSFLICGDDGAMRGVAQSTDEPTDEGT
jgi:hypothetical protein